MHPLTRMGILGSAATIAADRSFCRVPDRPAIAICLVCLALMIAGALLKKRMEKGF